MTPFEASEVNFHYTEANAWQYSFFVPHDLDGLTEMMGGREALASKLDEMFESSPELRGRNQVDITGLIGQYAHGNEPSHHVAYLYNHAGQPWKTQSRVREILDTLYSDQADGLPGNEDCGQMSAWYVLSALGFYPVTPGLPEYEIGTPLFPRATIHLESGRSFTIEAEGVSAEDMFIQSATLDERDHPSTVLAHADIMAGGTLVLGMGSKPNHEWGQARSSAPGSMASELLVLAPVIRGGSRSFTSSMTVELGARSADDRIRYTLDGSRPTRASPIYEKPIEITKSTTVTAVAEHDGQLSHPVSGEFAQRRSDLSIEISHPYNSQYTAGGDDGLIDGLRGGEDFRTGGWQGYQDTDFEAVIDMGKVRRVEQIGSGYLQDARSWIWMPTEVEYAISRDGKNFQAVATVANTVAVEDYEVTQRDFEAKLEAKPKARYVRVRAKNLGTIPDWHLGRGNPAFIFVDEVWIE
jgi:hypothetical protein